MWEAGLGLLLLLLLLLLLDLHFLDVGDASREGVLPRCGMLQLMHDGGQIRLWLGTNHLATRVVSSQPPRAVTAPHQGLRDGQRDGVSTCLVFHGRSARGWSVATDVDVTPS